MRERMSNQLPKWTLWVPNPISRSITFPMTYRLSAKSYVEF